MVTYYVHVMHPSKKVAVGVVPDDIAYGSDLRTLASAIGVDAVTTELHTAIFYGVACKMAFEYSIAIDYLIDFDMISFIVDIDSSQFNIANLTRPTSSSLDEDFDD